jgi:protocatechuate 3,4-dioxygenase beta subunit
MKFYFVLVATVLLVQVDGFAQQAGAGPKSSDGTTGAITGRVINSAGEPLPGTSITATSVTGARPQAAIANSNGEFRFDNLGPGLYRLFPLINGYVPPRQPTPTETVYYRIGDSATLTLIKGAVITGTVTDPNGPLVVVGVFVSRVRDEEGRKLTPAATWRERSTDDRGVFRFYGLAPGTYVVWAARPRVGGSFPSAYDNDTPTYFPSATRDNATEVTVHDGDEITTDIQYRAEPGHAVSGRVAGVFESQLRFNQVSSINLTNMQNGQTISGAPTNSNDNHSFAVYGVPDGEYEIYAVQNLPTGDWLRSPPQRISVRGGDVTGLSLTLAPLGSIEGRFVFENDPKAPCAKRRETAAPETIVKAWRSAPEKTNAPAKGDSVDALGSSNFAGVGGGDEKGAFTLRNLQPGNYLIDSQPPASGWYLKSIVIGTRTGAARIPTLNTARDGVSLKSGERVTGLLITITEGASQLHGRIPISEGKSLLPRMSVYLVPAEREATDNVLRFYEARLEADQSFTFDNINPGRYFIVAHSLADKDSDPVKSIRRDSSFRTAISQKAAAAKKEISFKPCERIVDYELPYSP